MGTLRTWRPTAVAAAAATVLAAMASTILLAPAHVEAAALAPGRTTGSHVVASSIRWTELKRRKPAAAAEAELLSGTGYLTPTSRGWLDRNLRSIGRDLRRTFRNVGRFFKRTTKKMTEAVRDVGRAVEKAVRDAGRAIEKAGQDVKKFVDKRVKEVRDFGRNLKKELDRGLSKTRDALRCLRGSSKCSRVIESKAQGIAFAEAEAAKGLAELNSVIREAQKQLEQETTKVQEQIEGLNQLLQAVPPPLNEYAKKTVYPGPVKQGEIVLALATEVQKTIAEEVAPDAEQIVKGIDDAAIEAQTSSALLATAQSAQRLLLGLTAAQNTLAEEMEKLTATLNKITSAMS
ncbi:hypothetical protein MMPV_008254 [Pyropia vietnamensis]